MLVTLHLLASLLYALALLGLLVYGLNAYVMIALHWWTRRSARAAPPPADPPVWPLVTVQLPLYNERYVAGRLLEAAGTLDYPADRLEIQVLDDSTDDTTAVVAETTQRLRARGVNVVHVRRTDRTGFKAGALASGLVSARGEFVAIFDGPSRTSRTRAWPSCRRAGGISTETSPSSPWPSRSGSTATSASSRSPDAAAISCSTSTGPPASGAGPPSRMPAAGPMTP